MTDNRPHTEILTVPATSLSRASRPPSISGRVTPPADIMGRAIATDRLVHVILDNYAAHKHPKVRQWLDRHPRFAFHFTPTSCSWLNAVEGFFAKLAKQRLKRGVFRCVVELQAAINRFVAETNDNPKPFSWTADPDKIIAAVRRGHQVFRSCTRPIDTAPEINLGPTNHASGENHTLK